jgi:hypothetical protein
LISTTSKCSHCLLRWSNRPHRWSLSTSIHPFARRTTNGLLGS